MGTVVMLSHKLFLIPLLVLLAIQSIPAQRSASWRVYRMADGLAEPGCASVTIGSRGKVIVGHSSQPFGAEVDGFDVAKFPAPASLPLRFYQSPGGQLWTVTGQGLLEYWNGGWVLHAIPEITGALKLQNLPAMDVRLWPVRQGLVLFLLPEGIYAFNTEAPQENRVKLILAGASTPLRQFSGMCSAQGGGVWISGTGGLLRLMPLRRVADSGPEWQAFNPPSSEYAGFREPREDAAGNVTLIATHITSGQKAIARFNGKGWEFQEGVPEDIVTAWSAGDRTHWALSPTSLYRWHEGELIRIYEDLSVRRINDLVLEPRGNFWLATSDGLFRYSPPLWRQPIEVADLDTPIQFLTPGPANSIWFLTGNSWFWVAGTNRIEVPLSRDLRGSSDEPQAVFVESTSSLAIEAEGALLQIALTPESPMRVIMHSSSGQYRAIGANQQGLLLVPLGRGANSDLLLFDGITIHPFLQLPPDLSIGNRLLRFFSTRNGNVWLSGTAGVALRREGKWEIVASPETSGPESALVFAEVGENKIWCSNGDRLWEYDGRDWTVVREGVDRIQSLLWTRDGRGWIGSNGGILRQVHGTWVELTMEDGLPSLDISRILEDNRNRIWAGTSHGLSMFFPDADPDPPRTRIEPLSERDRNIPESGAITIAYDAADKWKFTSRHRLLFSYRMDELDWSPFTELNRMSFGDLAPGTHYFQVRAMDRNGNIDAKPAMTEFSVVLPWYREGRLLVILATGVALALFFAVLAVNRHWRLMRSYAEVEQKVAERTRQLETANRELLQSQKMTALGTLAAGIAHDFNNILSIIKGSAQIIEDNLENHGKVRTRVDRIKTVVDQGAGIVKAMLGFSRASNQELLSINDIVAETVTLLGDRFLREVQVIVRTTPELPAIQLSKDFVQQILLNFIFNAAEAMTDRREIILETGIMDQLPENLVLSPTSSESYLRISVKDFGCGISPEHLPRIFEPFFTTKAFSSRRGTGLGLSMVYRLASRMGAGLLVKTAPNSGSTFTLILPALTDSLGEQDKAL